ncbi:NEDD8 isoform X2 [Lingula anatina]|uniref:NEDD8 isoform X2 n=1 Tax=Lingula anatina TaxID=7574 RepID=A0A1S3JXB3_LINAN|nr:NEDD8 isoform X2 [Lingula anatina]|eukprot:XP_013414679.1 NEDD8 isoform X2 [Lingula anatina]
MLLVVKFLGKSEQCSVEIQPSDMVETLKEQVEKCLGVPPEQQRLVFKGKPLADSQTLGAYKLSSGDKVFLTLKPGTAATGVQSAGTKELREALEQTLLRHFSAKDAKLVLKEFEKIYGKCIKSLNLDDIERLSAGSLQASGS